jgi:hypothetical protein
MTYLDEAHPILGGKLSVSTGEFNFSQLRSHSFHQLGYFTDDKLVFGQFDKK